jgi:hypothetical protein
MWTKEKPSKPGYYWLRNFTLIESYGFLGVDGSTTVVKVYRDAGDDDLTVALPGTEVIAPMADVRGEWQGPLYPSD